MADISKISISGTTYNVKDATARGDLTTIKKALGDISDYDGSEQGRNTIAERMPPLVTSADNGKVMKVVNGAWAVGSDNVGSSGLPSVTTSDNGKVLKVVDGVWAKGTDNSGGGGLSVTVNSSTETLVIG